MEISGFLSPNSIIFDLRPPDKTSLLRELARRAADAVPISAETIFLELAKREKLGSTGMGGGIAIPHARFAALKEPFGIVARLRPAVDFEAVDEKPVDLVFVLLVPLSSDKEHLNALAAVARRLRNREVVEKLRAARNMESFYPWMIGETEQPH